MHRKQHKKKSKKWLWVLLVISGVIIISIVAYLAGQLSTIKKDSSSSKSTIIISKAIKSSSINEDNESDAEPNNYYSESINNIESSNTKKDNSNNGEKIAPRIENLKTMTVCGCLLVEPDWFKTNNVTYTTEDNGQTGVIQDTNGNMVAVKYDSVNSVTITSYPAHNAENKTIQVTPSRLYTDYYNTRKKQIEVNDYVNNL